MQPHHGHEISHKEHKDHKDGRGTSARWPFRNFRLRQKAERRRREGMNCQPLIIAASLMGKCCQCANVASDNANGQLGNGNIGIDNTSTMATLNKSTVLGIHEGTAYVLLYNGILKDRSVNGGNVLTRKTLEVIQADLAGHDYEKIVVYGEACRLMAPTLEALKIDFRQTPYDLVTRM